MRFNFGKSPTSELQRTQPRSSIRLSASECFHLSEILWERLQSTPKTCLRRVDLLAFYQAIRQKGLSGQSVTIWIVGDAPLPSPRPPKNSNKSLTANTSLRPGRKRSSSSST